jgi:hypothetical protein
MRPTRLVPTLVAGILLGALAGCGGAKYAKVSGVVTLDGKGYKNAVVSFQPIGTPGNPAPGHGSTGLTDENGRFTLVSDDGQPGAVVGRHRVRIQTKRDDPTAYIDRTVGSPDNPGPQAAKVARDPIPLEWYDDRSTKEFDVPRGGTDKANFDIVTTRAAR